MKKVLVMLAASCAMACASAENIADWHVRDLDNAQFHVSEATAHLVMAHNNSQNELKALVEVRTAENNIDYAITDMSSLMRDNRFNYNMHTQTADQLLHKAKFEIRRSINAFSRDAISDFKDHAVNAYELLDEVSRELRSAQRGDDGHGDGHDHGGGRGDGHDHGGGRGDDHDHGGGRGDDHDHGGGRGDDHDHGGGRGDGHDHGGGRGDDHGRDRDGDHDHDHDHGHH